MAKKVAYSAMLIALSMIFSYVETLIPINAGVPGIKLGLANLIILLGIYLLDTKQVLIILLARILLSGFMFGNMSAILYSLSGGLFSFFMMYSFKRYSKLSMIGISIVGGVSHNVGQIIIAMIVVDSSSLLLYLPVLLVAGMMTGIVVGILANKLKKYLKNANIDIG